jgi:hypothetical protein
MPRFSSLEGHMTIQMAVCISHAHVVAVFTLFIYKDDDSASAQSRTNLGHDRRRSFSASRPRSFSMGREPMFSRDSFSRKDPKWGRDQSSSSREPSRDSEEKRRSESWSNERSSSDSWRCTEVRWGQMSFSFLELPDSGFPTRRFPSF